MGKTTPFLMGRTGRVLLEGVASGLIGAVAVALVLGLWSLATGRPFLFVPWALGSALAGSAVEGDVSSGPIGTYNALHVIASIFIGLGASVFVARAESRPALTPVLGLLAIVGAIYGGVLMGAFAVEASGVVSWAAVLMANVAGALATGVYLLKAHPRLTQAPDLTPTEL